MAFSRDLEEFQTVEQEERVVADSQPTRPPSPPLLRRLLTRDQVLMRLREERAMEGLTKTATKYQIAPQQLCDILAGRSKLSKRVAERLNYVLWTLYEKGAE
jgi:hypothetical protein